MPHSILIVDDELDIRQTLTGILQDEGYQALSAATPIEALETLKNQTVHTVILDVWLKTGERDGLSLLEKIRKHHHNLPIIMMSGHGTIEMAVDAMKHGAYDFIEKPFKTDRMLVTLARALETQRLITENAALREQLDGHTDLIGTSQVMNQVRTAIDRVAGTNSRVLLVGPQGVGKELVARAIHRASPRAGKPWVNVVCASRAEDDIERELFGSDHHPGLFTQVNGGTLYFDDVIDLPPNIQAKLLRVLQDQKYQHPTTRAWIDFDVRIMAGAVMDPGLAVAAGHFRQDLWQRLNTVSIVLPPLAARQDDVPAYLEHFMAHFARVHHKSLRALSPAALTALQVYPWPGNVQQLKNVAEWLVIMTGGEGDIDVDELPPEIRDPSSAPAHQAILVSPELLALPLREAREVFERSYLQAQVARFGGSVSRTANFVDMERSALHRKLRALGLMGGDGEETGEPSNQNAA